MFFFLFINFGSTAYSFIRKKIDLSKCYKALIPIKKNVLQNSKFEV